MKQMPMQETITFYDTSCIPLSQLETIMASYFVLLS